MRYNTILFQITLIATCLLFGSQTAVSQLSWEPTEEIASIIFNNNRPRIAVNGSGEPLVIWGRPGKVVFSKKVGDSFTPAVFLNPDTMPIAQASWMGPDIAAHGDTVYVVFKETPENSVSSYIWCVHSYDGGNTFSPPVQVEDVGDNYSRFAVVSTDAAGHPIVGLMRFVGDFQEPQWVIAKSTDFGASFLPEVLASGWSGAETEACDCCPGAIAASEDYVALIYRDNNDNLREHWAGISTDSGDTFAGGINVDQHNWIIPACPASGPDGVIIGDTLYTTFMSGATGPSRVYFDKASIPSMTSPGGQLIDADIPGLAQQNFPRMAKRANAVTVNWMQIVDGNNQLVLIYTDDIANGLPATHDILAEDHVTNTDAVISEDKVFVVWEDSGSGTVKFRSASRSSTTSVGQVKIVQNVNVFPNPSNGIWTLQFSEYHPEIEVTLFNEQGQLIEHNTIAGGVGFNHIIGNENLAIGTYLIKVSDGQEQSVFKVVKTY